MQASHTHDAIAEAVMLMKDAVDDIMVTLNEAASEVGMVGGMVDSITEAMAKVRWCTAKFKLHTHTILINSGNLIKSWEDSAPVWAYETFCLVIARFVAAAVKLSWKNDMAAWSYTA